MLLQASRPSAKKAISPAAAKRRADQIHRVNEAIIIGLSILLLVAEFGIPVCGVWKETAVPPIAGFILIAMASVVLLKLVSYVHCNWDLRQGYSGCCYLCAAAAADAGVLC